MASPASTIEGALVSMLLADAGVAALVGDRLHPFNVPASLPLPKLTYWSWGTDRSSDTGGFSNDGPSGHAVAKVFVDAWAETALGAKQASAAVRRALNGYRGTAGGVWPAGLTVRVNDEREQPGAMIPGRATPTQRVTLDLRIGYAEQ